jgi:hypothetical protein
MIRLKLLFAAAGVLVASGDTVWWNSTAGSVVQHRDADTVTCSMTLKSDAMQVHFIWGAGLPPRVVVERGDWRFQPGSMMDIAMQIGDLWIGDRNGTAAVPAMTGASSVMFVVKPDVERPLDGATRLRVVTASSGYDMALEPSRVRALLAGLYRCQAQIR